MSKKKNKFREAKIRDEAKALKEKLEKHCSQPGHRMPQTRREFLASGALALGVQLLPATFLSLVGRSAWAQEIPCLSASENFPAFINLQLAGGPALFANHLAHGSGGRPYDKYGLLGVGSNPNIEKYFLNDAPFYAPDGVVGNGRPGSGFLRGLKERMGTAKFNEIIGGQAAGTPGKTAFVSVACKSIDDRLTNEHDLAGMLSAAGLGGNSPLPHILAELGGRNVTANVGKGIKRFQEAFYPGPSYLKATDSDSFQAALGFSGALKDRLGSSVSETAKLQEQLIELINNLNKNHIQALVHAPGSKEGRIAARKLAYCSGGLNLQNLKSSNGGQNFDIYQNMDLANIWAKNFVNKTGSFDKVFKDNVTSEIGTAVVATLNGFSPACTLAIGGYDYHLNQLTSRVGQDSHDVFFGNTVANILLTADKLQKPVFLYVSTDGSVGSPNSIDTAADVAWRGDYGARGMNYIIAYHPTSTLSARGFSASNSSYEDASFQLNHFEEIQEGAFRDFVVSSKNPISAESAQDVAAGAVFLNYLEFAGLKSLIDRPQLNLVKSKLLQAASILGSADVFEAFSRIRKT